MTIPTMSPEKIERLFGKGTVTLGPKQNKESKKPSQGPFLTLEQDAELARIIREQSMGPFATQENDAKLEVAPKSRSVYELIIGFLTRGRDKR